jgi:hypothetical protein
MSAVEFLPDLGKASTCSAYGVHRPVPLRFVWHHVLPQVCGGLTVTANLSQVCDSCHYSIHILMWHIAQGSTVAELPAHTRNQLALALRGYQQALANGTAFKIPKEAST